VQTPGVRRSLRIATTKAHEGTFERKRAGSEVEETYGDFMPIHDGRSAMKSFDERFKALMDFKQKFGHCDVPRKKYGKGEYQSLGEWCSNLRVSNKKLQNRQTSHNKLRVTEENIRQLEDAGFKWRVSTLRTFDERFAELMKYKENVGHCNVTKSGEYQSLG